MRLAKGKTPESIIADLRAAGADIIDRGCKPMAAIEPAQAPKPVKGKPKLIEPSFKAEPWPTWEIGVHTVSESNTRDKWKSFSRIIKQRREICKAFARQMAALIPAAHRLHWMGSPVKIRLTRIAPGTLDTGNLWRAMKAAEDSVALYLGCDDRGDHWDIQVAQEKRKEYGLRIEIIT